MTEITLRVVSIDANPPLVAMFRTFSSEGGSIGRDDTNYFALPDKHRRVSRLHASISFPGGVATITNASSSLVISVNDAQIETSESVPIVNDAMIEIGPYLLRASFSAGPTMATHPAPFAVDPLAAFLGASSAGQPQVLTPNYPPPTSPVWPASPASVANAPLQPIAPAILPADFDLLMPPGSSRLAASNVRVSPPSDSSTDQDPFANLLAGIGGPPALHALSPAAPVPAGVPGISVDPMVAFGLGPSPAGAGPSAGHNVPRNASPTSQGTNNPFELPSDVARNSADPLAALFGPSEQTSGMPTGGTPSIDSLFQAHPGAYSSAMEATPSGSLLGDLGGNDPSIDGLIQATSSTDPLALFGSAAGAGRAESRPMRDDSMEVASSFAPPIASEVAAGIGRNQSQAAPVVAPIHDASFGTPRAQQSAARALAPAASPRAEPAAPPAALAQHVSNEVKPSVNRDALTEAFLRGAGLPPGALSQGLTPEIMDVIGSLLRSATGGAIDMLSARAATKREVQADVTIISVQANNPLKFMPNVDAALVQLLGKKMPGFMRADVAMRDAFDDLRAHEVGVIAGTRAALTEVLGKFDPKVLGDALTKGSVLESLMPSARKAKLWDRYLERYLQIRTEAEDDFQSIFGRAFVRAYERESARIKNQSGPGSNSGESET